MYVVGNALNFVFSFSIFLGALAYTVFMTTNEIPAAFDELSTTQTVYHVQTAIPNEESIYLTGVQVVGKLYRLTENHTVIKVDGVLFETDKDLEKQQRYINLKALYKQEFVFNTLGEVNMIMFTIQ